MAAKCILHGHKELQHIENDVVPETTFKPFELSPIVNLKLDELKSEVSQKVNKELIDSKNTRDYISDKYDQLCSKIYYLSELDSTVTGFRSDVMSIEKQISELSSRLDLIEKRTMMKDHPSFSSSGVV